MNLYLDVETYCEEVLKNVGAHKYCAHPSFEVILVGWAYEDNPVQIIDLASGEEIPEHIKESFNDEDKILHAHNAAFERLCFNAIGLVSDIRKWRCTMIKSAACGFPLGLDDAALAMGLQHQKDPKGKALIRYFCGPCKPTKVNEGRTRNLPHHDPEKWSDFNEYCKGDVAVEREIDKALEPYEMSDQEWELYAIDQTINDRGVRIDQDFARAVISIDNIKSEEIRAEMIRITGLDNPNSTKQLTEWLSDEVGYPVNSVAKKPVEEMIEAGVPEHVEQVLKLRQRAAKSSIKKYATMLNCAMEDSRGRGFFQFLGAFRTGRWAGRRAQLQNLPVIKIENIKQARDIVSTADYDLVSMCYDRISDVLSQLVRTAFVSEQGKILIPADFSSIEARVLAWFAHEQWRLDVFESHGKIYEASASMMFGVPIEEVTKASDYRAKGKVAELALGYQGAVGALKAMGGEAMGLSEEEMERIVRVWRLKNPNIVNFWHNLNRAAITCVQSRRTVILRGHMDLRFRYNGQHLSIELPSGRRIYYQQAELTYNRFNNLAVHYEGMDDKNQWNWLDIYGGKFAENIVQATARDLLAEAMVRLERNGYEIVLHVHDEAVCEVQMEAPESGFDVNYCLHKIESIMGEPVDWAEGLPLSAEGYISEFYKKE